MIKEEIEKLFPVKYEITDDIIQEGRKSIWSATKCTGGLSLGNILKSLTIDNPYSWGDNTGTIYEINEEDKYIPILIISTDKGIDFMNLLKPIEVEFQTRKVI